jgi:hypothetical protein
MYLDLQVPNYSVLPKVSCSSFAYKYHSVNGISYGLAQSGVHCISKYWMLVSIVINSWCRSLVNVFSCSFLSETVQWHFMWLWLMLSNTLQICISITYFVQLTHSVIVISHLLLSDTVWPKVNTYVLQWALLNVINVGPS